MLCWLQTLFTNFKINTSPNNFKSCIRFQETITLFCFIRELYFSHQRQTYMKDSFNVCLLSKSIYHPFTYIFAVTLINYKYIYIYIIQYNYTVYVYNIYIHLISTMWSILIVCDVDSNFIFQNKKAEVIFREILLQIKSNR